MHTQNTGRVNKHPALARYRENVNATIVRLASLLRRLHREIKLFARSKGSRIDPRRARSPTARHKRTPLH